MKDYDFRAQSQTAGQVHVRANHRVRNMTDAFLWPVYNVLKVTDADEARASFVPEASTRKEALELMYQVPASPNKPTCILLRPLRSNSG